MAELYPGTSLTSARTPDRGHCYSEVVAKTAGASELEVMVPAYGDRPSLREAVDSVLRQDDPNWRLTVVDDGPVSGEGSTKGWIAELRDDRIRYVANRVRLGINRNFQQCAQLAEADIVMLLGDDDKLLPDCVGRARRLALQHSDVAIIHMGAIVIDETGKPIFPLVDRVKKFTAPRIRGTQLAGGEKLATSLLNANWMYFPSCVFRRVTLQSYGFRDGLDLVLDLDLYLRLLMAGEKVLLLETPGIQYRRHLRSLSAVGAGVGSRFSEERTFFYEIMANLAAIGWRKAAWAARMHWTSRMHALTMLPGLIGGGDLVTAGRVMRQALDLGFSHGLQLSDGRHEITS